MKSTMEMTPAQIREAAHSAIVRDLGVTGLIRFLQDQSLGSGDYTSDRRQWLPIYADADEMFADVETTVAAMKKLGDLS